MSLSTLIDLPDLSDSRGGMISLEGGKFVPFGIKRIYYIFGTADGGARGFHAHIKLRQIAVCVSGSCRFVLHDGIRREEVVLSDPKKGLLIDSMIWREMHDFSSDCVLLVIASDHYEESDYIRSFDEFLVQTR